MQTAALLSPSMLELFKRKLRRTPCVEIVDPVLASRGVEMRNEYRFAMKLVWPKPLVATCAAYVAYKPTKRAPKRLYLCPRDQAARRDGFESFEDYEQHKRCMPRAYPSWEPMERAWDECVVCCDQTANILTKCNHELCSVCAAKLVKHYTLLCPFCKQDYWYGECTRAIASEP